MEEFIDRMSLLSCDVRPGTEPTGGTATGCDLHREDPCMRAPMAQCAGALACSCGAAVRIGEVAYHLEWTRQPLALTLCTSPPTPFIIITGDVILCNCYTCIRLLVYFRRHVPPKECTRLQASMSPSEALAAPVRVDNHAAGADAGARDCFDGGI